MLVFLGHHSYHSMHGRIVLSARDGNHVGEPTSKRDKQIQPGSRSSATIKYPYPRGGADKNPSDGGHRQYTGDHVVSRVMLPWLPFFILTSNSAALGCDSSTKEFPGTMWLLQLLVKPPVAWLPPVYNALRLQVAHQICCAGLMSLNNQFVT